MKLLKSLLASAFVLGTTFAFAQQFDEQLPSTPAPGKCYVKCITPDVFETKQVKVLVTPEYTTLTVVPAEFKTEEERIIVKPAYKKYTFVPATFKKGFREVEIEPSYEKLTVIPAKFSPSSSEELQVYPAVGRWEYGVLPGCKSENPNDCQTLCWKETPARYSTIPTQKMESNATTTSTRVTGTTQKYPVLEIDQPAKVNEVEVPAEYKVVTRRVKVKDETTTSVTVPAVYKTVEVQELKTKGGVTVWEEVDCGMLNYQSLKIYYDFAKATLRESSKAEIDAKLLSVMRESPNVTVEIASHTDSRGNAAANKDLSQRRAQSVVDYLVSKGINRNRLIANGYGEDRLVNRCADGVDCSEEQHQQNRRTEFRIVGAN